MQLRDYQADIVQKARLAIRELKSKGKKPRILLQLPTGGGKTAIASFIAKSALSNGKTVDFLCHRDFLVDQTSKTFGRMDIDHTFIASGRWHNEWSPARVAMVQTLRNRVDKIRAPDICLWDEAHHISASGWSYIMNSWPDTTTHIGLSATPCRLDGKGLDDHFEKMILGPTIDWLIKNGYLSDYVMYTPSTPDMTGVKMRAGDFAKNQVGEIMDKSVIIGDMVSHYRRLANGKRAVYFCTSVKHSQHTADMFSAAGIPAIHLDGDHSTFDRKQAAMAFARGDVRVLTNVDLFGEGYDLSAQAEMDVTIEAVGLARPTNSLGLYMQQVGRVLRPEEGKTAIILDHAGNLERHGLVDDDREWSLQGVKKKVSSGEASQTKECVKCFARIRINVSTCSFCNASQGKPKEGAGSREVEEEDGELEQVDKDAVKKARKLEEWHCSTIQELTDLGRRRGYKNPEKWAGFMWTSRIEKKKKRAHSEKQQMDFYSQLMGRQQ